MRRDCRYCELQEIVMQIPTARSLLQVQSLQSGTARSTGLFDAVTSVVRAVVQWQRQRRDVMQLLRMDDRLLADIGITRSEAESMVRNGRWAKASFEPESFPATRP